MCLYVQIHVAPCPCGSCQMCAPRSVYVCVCVLCIIMIPLEGPAQKGLSVGLTGAPHSASTGIHRAFGEITSHHFLHLQDLPDLVLLLQTFHPAKAEMTAASGLLPRGSSKN